MPAGWDRYHFSAIGPRHLEAVMTRTCQILIEGHYDGLLLPDRHYLPLRKDFGNLDEICQMIRDTALLQKIADTAYEDVCRPRKYLYSGFAQAIADVLHEDASRQPQPEPAGRFWPRYLWWRTLDRLGAPLRGLLRLTRLCVGTGLRVLKRLRGRQPT
jgi:hypothetical protein